MIKNKICIILLIFLVLSSLLSNFVYADNPTTTTGLDGLGDLGQYKGTPEVSNKLKGKVGNILGVIQTIGIALSVVVLTVIGIKYMLGSVEERADYKKTLIPYVIGAIIVFSMSTIPQLIYDLMKAF